ncbi:hypothetical protein Tco_1086784 [Tanacetum coccineum]
MGSRGSRMLWKGGTGQDRGDVGAERGSRIRPTSGMERGDGGRGTTESRVQDQLGGWREDRKGLWGGKGKLGRGRGNSAGVGWVDLLGIKSTGRQRSVFPRIGM